MQTVTTIGLDIANRSLPITRPYLPGSAWSRRQEPGRFGFWPPAALWAASVFWCKAPILARRVSVYRLNSLRRPQAIEAKPVPRIG